MVLDGGALYTVVVNEDATLDFFEDLPGNQVRCI